MIGQYPEIPEETVIFTAESWRGEVLCELTLAEFKALKRLVEKDDEDKLEPTGTGSSS